MRNAWRFRVPIKEIAEFAMRSPHVGNQNTSPTRSIMFTANIPRICQQLRARAQAIDPIDSINPIISRSPTNLER